MTRRLLGIGTYRKNVIIPHRHSKLLHRSLAGSESPNRLLTEGMAPS